MVVGVLTRCVLFHTVCDFKAAQMNGPRCLIRSLVLYKFELSHKKQPKTFVARNGEDAVDHSTVIPMPCSKL